METPKDELLKDVLEHFDVSYAQFDGSSRKKNIIITRKVYYYVLYVSGYSINDITMEMGRDRSSIANAIKTIKKEIETNDEVNNLVTNLLKKYKT